MNMVLEHTLGLLLGALGDGRWGTKGNWEGKCPARGRVGLEAGAGWSGLGSVVSPLSRASRLGLQSQLQLP